MKNKIKTLIQDSISLVRMDNIPGALLLFFPCAFGTVLLCPDDYEAMHLIALFFIGSVLMRGAGCGINDIWDREIDAKVQRTQSRPLARRSISMSWAIVLVLLLCLTSCLILRALSVDAIFTSLAAVPLVVIYPMMKRVTYLPQLFLGLAFNYGILITSMHFQGQIMPSSAWLYVGCIFWTLGYDSIYGFMDYRDDLQVGVKSLSLLLLRSNPKVWLMLFYCMFAVLLIISATIENVTLLSLMLWVIMLNVLFWQVITLDIHNPQNCLVRFKSNIIVGLLATGVIFAARMYEN